MGLKWFNDGQEKHVCNLVDRNLGLSTHLHMVHHNTHSYSSMVNNHMDGLHNLDVEHMDMHEGNLDIERNS